MQGPLDDGSTPPLPGIQGGGAEPNTRPSIFSRLSRLSTRSTTTTTPTITPTQAGRPALPQRVTRIAAAPLAHWRRPSAALGGRPQGRRRVWRRVCGRCGRCARCPAARRDTRGRRGRNVPQMLHPSSLSAGSTCSLRYAAYTCTHSHSACGVVIYGMLPAARHQLRGHAREAS